MERGFYNLHNGGSTDMALPVMVHRIARHDEQSRTSISHILDVSATAEVTAARLRRLDEDHDQTRRIINYLQEDVTTSRAEIREFMDRHAFIDQKVIEVERRAEEAREKAREMRAFIATLRGSQDVTRHE